MIRFLYFEGCPNAGEIWKNLKQFIQEDHISEKEIEKIEVPDMEKAEKFNFQGSPTILINGIDIYTGLKPVGVHYTCRIFQFNEKSTGIMPTDFIRKKYYELQQQPHED